MGKRESYLVPVLCVLGAMISLASGANLAKALFSQAGPIGLTVVRTAIGAAILCVFWRPWRFGITKAQVKAILPYGICLGLMNLSFYLAIERLPIGLAIAIEFLGPLAIALLYSKKLFDLVWAGLAALGIFLILPVMQSSDPIDLVGVGYAMGAAFMWALYIVLGKKAGASAHAGVVTSLGMLIAFISTVPFGIGNASNLFSTTTGIALAVGVGLLSAAIPYSLEMFALKRLPEKYFGLLMSLEPAIGSVLSFIYLREVLSPLQIAAIFCVVVASVGSGYTHKTDPVDQYPA
ncbi:MAG: DMT family transporter [Bdellovibrionota bacterium]